MKLKVKRFNTRRPDPVAEPVMTAAPRVVTQGGMRPTPAAILQTSATPQARVAAGGAQSGSQGGSQIVAQRPVGRSAPTAAAEDRMFETHEDGFGAEPFPTAATATPEDAAANADIDAIRREGLTGRQLRLARRMAQKYGLPATSDFDAVRLLRAAGIDPFQRSAMIEVLA